MANAAFAPHFARFISLHLTVVVFTFFAAYVFRDLWPQMTVARRPMDDMGSSIPWLIVGLSGWAGVLEPLLEPYPHNPIDPEVRMISLPFVSF